MAEDAIWTEPDGFLKTEGPILQVGSFISRKGNIVDVSETDKTELFNNIDGKIPMGITHDATSDTGPTNYDVIGYASKFAIVNDMIDHKGLVIDSKRYEEAQKAGYTYISPMIDFEVDKDGKVVNKKIVRLDFVPNPAMPNNIAEVKRFAFSAPEVTMTPDTQEENITQEPTAEPKFDPTEFAKTMAESIAEGISTKFGEQINSLKQEIETLKSKPVEALKEPETPNILLEATPIQAAIPKEIIEQLANLESSNKQYAERIAKEDAAYLQTKMVEVKTLGYDIPEKLLKSMRTDREKGDFLEDYKVELIKRAPMNSQTTTPLGAEGGKPSKKQQMTITGLANSKNMGSIPENELKWLSTRLEIPAV